MTKYRLRKNFLVTLLLQKNEFINDVNLTLSNGGLPFGLGRSNYDKLKQCKVIRLSLDRDRRMRNELCCCEKGVQALQNG